MCRYSGCGFNLRNILLNSGDSMSQKYLAGSPSGPGDLLFGILFRAVESSLRVRGASKSSAFSVVSLGN